MKCGWKWVADLLLGQVPLQMLSIDSYVRYGNGRSPLADLRSITTCLTRQPHALEDSSASGEPFACASS